MERMDGRAPDAPRSIRITPDYVSTAHGSCLMEMGGTRVICTASVEEDVPPFLRGKGCGWLTAEYAMLPASTGRRKARDGVKKDGRGVEIGRLIGRALRQAVDRERLGARTITIDCDVLEADGGTRTAAVTGGFVALVCAVDRLMGEGKLPESPVIRQVAAISAGVAQGTPLLDLNYAEDSRADADVNLVMDDQGALIELQGTGEGRAFTRGELDLLLDMGARGCLTLMEAQRAALGARAGLIGQKPKLVLASDNPHKLRELRALLGERYDVLSMREAGFAGVLAEDGETFEQNARLKAEAVSRATGLLTLADDSGLCVDALDGAPGVRSARFAGEGHSDRANNALLMDKLRDVPPEARTARFVCCVAIASPLRDTRVTRGECQGVITRAPLGEGGFGYDPYFLYENGLTFAQMPEADKNRVSHRARAMEQALRLL